MMFLAALCVFTVSTVSAQVGPSGIVSRDGNNVQFSHDFANNIVLIGPSGIVTKNGRNVQLTDAQVFPNVGAIPVATPVASFVSQRGTVGPSGIVSPTGRNIQFTHEQANNIVLVGPSGIVTKNGQNIQFTEDLGIARKKRSIGYVSTAGNVGTSGILRADGSTDLFDFDTAHNVLLIGPSGIVTKDGRNIQLTRDLHIANNAAGTVPQKQSRTAGKTILLEGPSGYVFTDGTLLQKTL